MTILTVLNFFRARVTAFYGHRKRNLLEKKNVTRARTKKNIHTSTVAFSKGSKLQAIGLSSVGRVPFCFFLDPLFLGARAGYLDESYTAFNSRCSVFHHGSVEFSSGRYQSKSANQMFGFSLLTASRLYDVIGVGGSEPCVPALPPHYNIFRVVPSRHAFCQFYRFC